MSKRFTDTVRHGKNEKLQTVRKDGFLTWKFSDVVTPEGTIRQEAVKECQVSSVMQKTYKVLREHLIKAVKLGYHTEGVLTVSVTDIAPKKALDTESLIVFLANHGERLENFYKEGEPGERLIIQ